MTKPMHKKGLWCICGRRIKQGTMLDHWRKEHREVDLSKQGTKQ